MYHFKNFLIIGHNKFWLDLHLANIFPFIPFFKNARSSQKHIPGTFVNVILKEVYKTCPIDLPSKVPLS